MEQTRQGKLEIQIRNPGFDDLTYHIDHAVNRIAVALIVLGGLVGSSIVGVLAKNGPHVAGLHLLSFIGFILSGIFALWLIWGIARSGQAVAPPPGRRKTGGPRGSGGGLGGGGRPKETGRPAGRAGAARRCGARPRRLCPLCAWAAAAHRTAGFPRDALAWAGGACREVTAHVQQVHGGIGFALEGGIHRYYRRAKTVQVWTDAVLRELA